MALRQFRSLSGKKQLPIMRVGRDSYQIRQNAFQLVDMYGNLE
jgi:hypothetical protein